jgi:hypothetical protein
MPLELRVWNGSERRVALRIPGGKVVEVSRVGPCRMAASGELPTVDRRNGSERLGVGAPRGWMEHGVGTQT